MRLIAFCLALTVGSAASAQAPSQFATFRGMCVETGADAASALAEADAAGWMAAPKAMLQTMANDDFQVRDGRLRSNAEGMEFMVVGSGTRPLGRTPFKMNLCLTAFMPGDGAALKREVAAYAAVPRSPELSRGRAEGYVFTQSAMGHQPLKGARDADALEAMRRGSVRMLFVEQRKEGAFVGYAVPSVAR